MNMFKRAAIALAIAVPVAISALAAAAQDVAGTLASGGSFKTLANAVQSAGLVDKLKGKGPFTLFAPTDEAFAKLPAGTLDKLLKPANRKMLRALVAYHVLDGKKLTASRIIQARNFDIITVEGSRAEIDTKLGPRIEGARILQADISATNGVIHVIDKVMLPPTLKRALKRGAL